MATLVADDMALANRVETARKARGFTQEQLAPLAGITVSTLRKIEQGIVTNPEWTTMLGLRKVLGLNLEVLAEEHHDSEPPKESRPVGRPPKKRRS